MSGTSTTPAIFAHDAPYSELVRAASASEASLEPAHDACIMRARDRGYALTAELAPAVRPLPLPPSDLDEALKHAESVELLSAWGRYGEGSAPLALASFTAAAPTHGALALVLTDRGIALRPASAHTASLHEGARVQPSSTMQTRASLSLQEALAQLANQPAALVFVTAEAALPLSKLYETLAALDARGVFVVLAVALASDVRLPPPVAARVRPVRCDDGLSATDAPEGALDANALRQGLTPLRERVLACLTQGDAPGAAGGRLRLALRIAASGGVQEACVPEDGIGDPGVAACVVELARTLRFAPPAPSGVVDIELPLVLEPSASPTQRPLCAP